MGIIGIYQIVSIPLDKNSKQVNDNAKYCPLTTFFIAYFPTCE